MNFFRRIGEISDVWCEKFADKLEPSKQWVDICQEEFSQVPYPYFLTFL